MEKKFKVFGTYNHRGEFFNFSKHIASENEESAKELVLCKMGSNHRLKRGQIIIEKVEAVTGDKPKAE
ncbi:MAG: 50S ribosomal protein L18Ae [archaeon]